MRSMASNGGRHGVVLLVILGMLTMFAMVAVAFVILSGQARRGAEHFRDMELRAISPKDELDSAAAQVLRGSNSPASVMGAHSLLEDVYGANARLGQIQDRNQLFSTPATQGMARYNSPLIEFPIIGASHAQFAGAMSVAARPSECIGCVLTFLNGPAAGVSTRIVAVMPFDQTLGRPVRFQVLAREDLSVTRLYNHLNSNGGPLLYLVNGTPFTGMGFGVFPGGSLNTSYLDGNSPLTTSLLPNAPVNRPTANLSPYGTRALWGPPCGANEDYDAPDFQNMLLAMVNPLAVSSTSVPKVPIPSLHRAELCLYWRQRGATSAQQLAQYCLRPMKAAHPRFTGSNPSFNAEWDGRGGSNHWDVDNDNDGVPDSVWVDLGMPARPAKDGRMCKPLFAIMCLDMDGRFNLNAHGSNIQTVAGYYQETLLGGQPTYPGNALMLRRGQGYGPPEINMRPLFERTASTPAQAITEYARILREIPRSSTASAGRYGDGVPGVNSTQGAVSPLFISRHGASYAPLLPLPVDNDVTGAFDPSGTGQNVAPYRQYGLPPFDRYGSPADWDGNGVLAFEHWGWPHYDQYMRDAGRNVVGLPYVFNLYANRGPHVLNHPLIPSTSNRSPGMAKGYDAPFTPGEFERLLRPYDSDSGLLPTRLVTLSQPNANTLARLLLRRGEVTTESWDLPCPAVSIPVESRNYTTGNLTDKYAPTHILTLLRRRMAQARPNPTAVDMEGNTINDGDVLSLAYQLLPPEVIAGQRMDVNHAFGNGRDDADTPPRGTNGVVDEPEEGFPGAPVSGTAGAVHNKPVEPVDVMLPNGTVAQVAGDAANGETLFVNQSGTPDPYYSKILSRQLYARQLYCLALLVLDTRIGPVNNTDARRRELAQWAVNVVDFRDRDSIMTRFDYDPNPFDGWSPPKPTTGAAPPALDVCTVMGCERPELLITETLALHDHRTEDLGPTDPNGVEADAYLDPAGEPANYTIDTPPTPPAPPLGAPPASDSDYDQRYVPQGSLFVELFNPWNPTDYVATEYSSKPLDPLDQNIATKNGLVAGVNLAARTPVGGHPVWRLMITEQYRMVFPQTTQFKVGSPVDIDRLEREDIAKWRNLLRRKVYFVDPGTSPVPFPKVEWDYASAAAVGMRDCGYHWTDPIRTGTPVAPIMPGRYALIGPGNDGPTGSTPPDPHWNRTFLGFMDNATRPITTTRHIQLTPNANPAARSAVQVLYNLYRGDDLLAGSSTTPFIPPVQLAGGSASAIEPPVAIIVNRSSTPNVTRLSISEPPGGYILPSGVTIKNDETLSDILDKPLDSTRTDILYPDILKHTSSTQQPIVINIVHLQRLANPLIPFDNDLYDNMGRVNIGYNPYITVDRMPVELYVFDGFNAPNATADNEFLGIGPNPNINIPIRTRERGADPKLANDQIHIPGTASFYPSPQRNIWWQDVDEVRTLAGPPGRIAFGADTTSSPRHTVKESFDHTLGFCNYTYGGPTTDAGLVGQFGTARGFPDVTADPRDPTVRPPFPCLNWHNRPFVSQMEIMLVPRYSAATLLSPVALSLIHPQFMIYTTSGPDLLAAPQNFNHLAQFFTSTNPDQGSMGGFNNVQWHRLLEFLHVPSRFVGAQTQLPPDRMAAPSSSTVYAPHHFHPPFNWVSKYRDPGRININTVFSFDVFRGLLNNWLDFDYEGNALATDKIALQRQKQILLWSKLVRSRKGAWTGFGANTELAIMNQMLTIDYDVISTSSGTSGGGSQSQYVVPTRFANPFRSFAGGTARPMQLARQRDSLPHTTGNPPMASIKILDEIEATLLRPDPDQVNLENVTSLADYQSNYKYRQPLFRRVYSGSTNDNFLQRNHGEWRNPYSQLDEIMRLGNLITTRSNVYAVWITVGYFEAYKKAVGYNIDVWPDGYELGPELGLDTGEVERHRAFYFMDRSIPVGFMRGQDLNIDKAILVRRFLE